jgi:hypothetical protein
VHTLVVVAINGLQKKLKLVSLYLETKAITALHVLNLATNMAEGTW